MLYILLAVTILGVDIMTKIWAKAQLAGNVSVPIIEDVFHLTYVENRGAAFGILQNAWVFFIVVAVILFVVVLWLLKTYKERHVLMKLGLSFLCAGALGNTIDRIMQGYVVDFFDFRLIDFPVFNVADIFVCVGAGVLAVFFIFLDSKGNENNSKEKADKTENNMNCENQCESEVTDED